MSPGIQRTDDVPLEALQELCERAGLTVRSSGYSPNDGPTSWWLPRDLYPRVAGQPFVCLDGRLKGTIAVREQLPPHSGRANPYLWRPTLRELEEFLDPHLGLVMDDKERLGGIPYAEQVVFGRQWFAKCPRCEAYIPLYRYKDAESFTGEEYAEHYRVTHALRDAENDEGAREALHALEDHLWSCDPCQVLVAAHAVVLEKTRCGLCGGRAAVARCRDCLLEGAEDG